jgi:hypothetical protein
MGKDLKQKMFLNSVLKKAVSKANLSNEKASVELTLKLTVSSKKEGCWCVCETDDDGNVYCTCYGGDECGDCCD